MRKWYGLAVLVVLVLAVVACTDDQYLWWERQGDEISDEVVQDFCVDRLEYCSNAAERLAAVVEELKGREYDAAESSTERSVKIEWGESYYADTSASLPRPFSVFCGIMGGAVCWTLRYELEGDWGRPPYKVYCLTDGEVSQEFVLQLIFSVEPVGCIFMQRDGRGPTGSAQVVIDSVFSNILPSRG